METPIQMKQGETIMQKYAKIFTQYMDANDIKYTVKRDNVVEVSYNAENKDSISFFVIFDEDNDPLVAFKCWSIENFKNKEAAALVVCNVLNEEYRWVKFYLDKDKDMNASIDAMIDEETCGEECMSLVRRVVHIVDDAYPKIAKARWA